MVLPSKLRGFFFVADAAKKLEKQTEKTLVLEEMVQALTEQKLSSVQANDLLRKHSEKAQLEVKEALQAKDNLETELAGKDRCVCVFHWVPCNLELGAKSFFYCQANSSDYGRE